MKHELVIPIHDLDAGGKQFRFTLRAEWIDSTIAHASAPDEDDVLVSAPKQPSLSGDPVTSAGVDGEFDVRVSKSGVDVVVHGKLRADLLVPCARCLRPAKVHIEQPVTVLMVPASAAKKAKAPHGDGDDDAELAAEEADVLPYSGDSVILDDLVRDELLLEIPMIPLCSPDCPGISPPPGMLEERAPDEPAIDPRLAPLLKFRKQD